MSHLNLPNECTEGTRVMSNRNLTGPDPVPAVEKWSGAMDPGKWRIEVALFLGITFGITWSKIGRAHV